MTLGAVAPNGNNANYLQRKPTVSNLKQATGALFGTVATTATAASTLVQVIAGTVELSGNWVQLQQEKQLAAHKLERLRYVEELADGFALEDIRRQAAIGNVVVSEEARKEFMARKERYLDALSVPAKAQAL